MPIESGKHPASDSVTGASRSPEVGIISLVPDSWNGPWQPRHQILTRLGSHFEVLWVEDAFNWRLLVKDARVRRQATGFGGKVREGFYTYMPDLWLPRVYSPVGLGRFLARMRLLRARRYLLSLGCKKIVLDLWRPEHAYALDLVPHDLSCYHIDDEYSFSEVELPLDPGEAALIARVNQVFISSQALLEKKGRINPKTLVVPNGVNYQAYTETWAEPEELKSIPHPRIGYVGVVKKQMDLELMMRLARLHPEWSFVLVGPRGVLGDSAEFLAALERMPNVRVLGGRPVDSLPAYTQALDVCLLSYKVNDYSKFIYPLKLHEYLAGGRPVVGPPIPALKGFGHVVRLATTVEEWSKAIQQALLPEDSAPARVAERRRIAQDFDWNVLTGHVAAAIREGLAAKPKQASPAPSEAAISVL